MKFTDGTIATVAANRIFQRTRTVVDTMDKVMIQEKVDSPRYGRFVYRVQLILQIEQAESSFKSHHRFQDKQADGCRSDFSLFQYI